MTLTQSQYDLINTKLEDWYEKAINEMTEVKEEGKPIETCYSLGVYTGLTNILTMLDINTYTKTADGCVQIEASEVVN